MSSAPFSLDVIQVASPCRASWDGMAGDERVRHCGECQRNVYNLSAMTRADAEALILKSEDRLCIRFYKRQDGTMLTADCPVGAMARAGRKLAGWMAAGVALVGLAAYQMGLGRWLGGGANAGDVVGNMARPLPTTTFPGQPFSPTRGMVMGEACPPAGLVTPAPPTATPPALPETAKEAKALQQ